jgi:fibronectin type 3 domain-containing protein
VWLGTPSAAVLTITDDDGGAGTVQFSAGTYTVGEGGSSVTITATRTGGSVGAASVNYATANGTATAGSDYTAASGTLSWAAGVIGSKTFTVPISQDTLVEGNETINLTLSGAVGATLGPAPTSVITITDDDGGAGTVQFSAGTYTVGEGGGSVTITATRTGGSVGAASVNYATANGTAAAGSDYTATSGTLSWAAGVIGSKTFTVPITQDAAVEGNETINVTLSGAVGATLGPAPTSVITITDDDGPVGALQFSATSYLVAENGGTAVTVTVTRVGASSGAVSATYATADGTAVASVDYVATSGSLSWANGDATTKSFSVPLINDSVFEAGEYFDVTLAGVTGAMLGSPSTAAVEIADDDGGMQGELHFKRSEYSVGEGAGSVAVEIVRVGGSVGGLGRTYGTVDVTATAGSDYVTTGGQLYWGDGDTTSRIVSVPITQDLAIEVAGDETFFISYSGSSADRFAGGFGVSEVGTPGSVLASLSTEGGVTIRIVDDDGPGGTLQFSAGAFAVSEAAGSTVIGISRTGGTSGTASVSYSTFNGTALGAAPGSVGDFTAVTGTLSWAAGESGIKSFTLPIQQDTSVEGNETINLVLSGATGATLGALGSAVATITDDDGPAGTLQFSASAYTVGEGDGNVTLTATRTGGSNGVVSVNYATSNGTASAGSDFTNNGGTLSWANGDVATKTFTVPITQDTLVEGSETINVTLSGATGTTLGAPATAVITITDDDVADTTPPTAPTSPTATAASSTQINVSWTASTDNVGVTGYRVERCQGAGCTSFSQVGTPTATSFSDTALAASTTYLYRIRATDAAGLFSGYSTTVSATTQAAPDTTPPTAPTSPAATAASSTQINVSWTASTDNVGVTGYRVERCQGAGCTSFAQVGTPTATSFSDTGLTASTTYLYRIRATDAAGLFSVYSATVSATTQAAPDTTAPTAPASLTATPSGSQVALSWAAATDNVGVTSYSIERCTGAGCTGFAPLGSSVSTSYTDTTVAAATTYRYQVRATDAAGNWGGYSPAASASIQDSSPPSAPTGLTVTPGTTTMALTWLPSSDNVGVTGYAVERCQGAGCATSTYLQIAFVTGTTFTDTGLFAGVTYGYRVRAQDAAGLWSGYSGNGNGVMGECD